LNPQHGERMNGVGRHEMLRGKTGTLISGNG
jgi:hypothetical protein